MPTFAQFLVDQAPRLRRFALSACAEHGCQPTREELEDLVQDCLLGLLKSCRGRALDKCGNYLQQLAVNTVNEWWFRRDGVHVSRRTKSRKRLRRRALHDGMPDTRRPRRAEQTARIDAVRQALEVLNPNYRSLLQRAYGIDAEKTAVAAIARQENRSRATIRFKLAKALRQLRQRWPGPPP